MLQKGKARLRLAALSGDRSCLFFFFTLFLNHKFLEEGWKMPKCSSKDV